MIKIARHALSAVAVLACAMGASAPAIAVFVARICNDLQCMGGDDVIVQDNAAGDSIGMSGAISFATAAFGYTLVVNTSQSKPVIGSATAPQLDLSFVVTSGRRRQRLPVRLGHRFPHRRPVHAHPRRHELRRQRQRPGSRLGRHEQHRVPVLGREPAQLARSLHDRLVLGERNEPVHARREPVLADDRHDRLAHDGRHEHRQPEPAGLRDPRTQHLGVDTDGAGARRLRRPPTPQALGEEPDRKARFGGPFRFSARPEAQSGVVPAHERRRPAIRAVAFEGMAEREQARLAPRRADEREADRQAADEARRAP